jgi:hypothetical protein
MAIAALLVALAVAGCGSSSSSTTSTAALTKAEFLAKGNAICVKTNKVTNAAGQKFGNHPTKAQLTTFVTTQFVPSVQGAINGLKALGAPAGDQAKVAAMLALAQADLNKVKANPILFISGGPSTFANFAKVAHAYGLTECAKKA